MSTFSLIGIWSLESFELQSSSGEISYPYGKAPVGYIMYNNDGFMSVAIMSAGRQRFAANDIFGGTSEEKIAAIDTYLSYSGRYEITQQRVLHQIEVSLFPNWVGTTQERIVALRGDSLQLSTDTQVINGQPQTARLIWKRVRSA
jgi:hypothetical protein